MEYPRRAGLTDGRRRTPFSIPISGLVGAAGPARTGRGRRSLVDILLLRLMYGSDGASCERRRVPSIDWAGLPSRPVNGLVSALFNLSQNQFKFNPTFL
jgi:hypothetical protein